MYSVDTGIASVVKGRVLKGYQSAAVITDLFPPLTFTDEKTLRLRLRVPATIFAAYSRPFAMQRSYIFQFNRAALGKAPALLIFSREQENHTIAVPLAEHHPRRPRRWSHRRRLITDALSLRKRSNSPSLKPRWNF